MIKTGIVMSIMNRKAGIMTSGGEFIYIKISKVLPNIGEIYTGELYKNNFSFYKYAISVASLMFIFVSSAYAHSYYTPVSTIVLSTNPSVSITANKWNKIISSKPLNSDGALVLNKINLKNKSIDTGLELIVKEAKIEKFIDNKYVNDKKPISVDIKSNENISIDISNFKNIIDTSKLNIKINVSSVKNKSIDITINNKKINIYDLNDNNIKKETTNNKTDVNISKNKPSKIKEIFNPNTKVVIKKDNKISNKNNSSTLKKHNIPNRFEDTRQHNGGISDKKFEKPSNDNKFKTNFYKIQRRMNIHD